MSRQRPATLRTEIDLHNVNVRTSEVLTVWLGTHETDADPPRTQVELRVLPDGTREIFVDDPAVRIRPFSEWYEASR